MTLKAFKAKFRVGMTVYHVRNIRGPVGVIRTVAEVQGNGVWFEPSVPGGSRWWMPFPKAANLEAGDAGFTIKFPAEGPNDHDKVSEYLWEPPRT